jgi:hypothetical protein
VLSNLLSNVLQGYKLDFLLFWDLNLGLYIVIVATGTEVEFIGDIFS